MSNRNVIIDIQYYTTWLRKVVAVGTVCAKYIQYVEYGHVRGKDESISLLFSNIFLSSNHSLFFSPILLNIFPNFAHISASSQTFMTALLE